jgi:hypothetical protein
MQELVNELKEKAGLSEDQASKSISVIKDFVKNKYPMLAGAVDNMLGADAATTTTATPVNQAAAAGETPVVAQSEATKAEAPKEESGSILDKISDVIPGQIGEKIEDVVKGLGDKIGGVFGK